MFNTSGDAMFKRLITFFTRRNAPSDQTLTPQMRREVKESADRIAAFLQTEAERTLPFDSDTPHARIHSRVTQGKPDGLIAVELGVDVAAVRNYRHIIGAKGRHQARRRALEARIPAMLARGDLDEDIAAELGVELRVVKNVRDDMVAHRRRQARDFARRNSVPAVCAPPPAPSDTLTPIALGLTAALLANTSRASAADVVGSCPAPEPAPSSDSSSSGDFGSIV